MNQKSYKMLAIALVFFFSPLTLSIPILKPRLDGALDLGNYSNLQGNIGPEKDSPVSTPVSSVILAPFQTAVFNSSTNPDFSINMEDDGVTPESIRGKKGSVGFGPANLPLMAQNPDSVAPPSTDHGSTPQSKWSFALSHQRIESAGWAKQQNEAVLPVATEIAGVTMHLEPNAYRELHWHTSAEWAYVLAGTVRVSSVDTTGKSFVDDTSVGDLWYFPAGRPHSLQAHSEGAEFLLVFDDGGFNEDETFLLTDWLAHIPREVLAKNFQVDLSVFKDIPESQLYIFHGTEDNNTVTEDFNSVNNPYGEIPDPFSFHFSQQPATNYSGGSVKVVDSGTFAASTTIAAALVTIDPGALRVLHWHPTNDEWSYFISGKARVTVFASSSNSRTFDFQAGDVGYIPASQPHYIESIGDEPVVVLEIMKSDKFTDISLAQWLSLTPHQVTVDTLSVSKEFVDGIDPQSGPVVGGRTYSYTEDT